MEKVNDFYLNLCRRLSHLLIFLDYYLAYVININNLMGFFDQVDHKIFIAIIMDLFLLFKLLICLLEMKCYYFQKDYL